MRLRGRAIEDMSGAQLEAILMHGSKIPKVLRQVHYELSTRRARHSLPPLPPLPVPLKKGVLTKLDL